MTVETQTQEPVQTPNPAAQETIKPVEQTTETTTRISDEGDNSTNSNTDNSKDISNNNTNKDTTTDNTIVNKDTLTQVQTFLEEAGLVPSEIAKEFTKSGELSIDSMAKLVKEHGESVANLIVGQLKGLHQQNVKAAQARDEAVFKQVEEAFKGITEQGGKETWAELAGWAKTNVPNEARSELNGMLQKGGLQAQLAVDYLVNKFKTSEDYQQPAELLGADSTPTDYGSSALSKQEYLRELDILIAKGHDYNTSPEIRKLEARRMKGMQRGI